MATSIEVTVRTQQAEADAEREKHIRGFNHIAEEGVAAIKKQVFPPHLISTGEDALVTRKGAVKKEVSSESIGALNLLRHRNRLTGLQG